MSNRESRAPARASELRLGDPDRFDRVRGYLAARPWIADSLLWALPLASLAVISAVGTAKPNTLTSMPVPVHAAIALLQTAPLALRRTTPMLSTMVIAFGCLLSVLTMIGPNFGIVAVPLTVYSTTVWGTRTHGRIALCLGLVGALLFGGWFYLVSLQATIGPDSHPLELGEYLLIATIVALCAAIVLIAWLLGDVGYRRRREVEGIWERNRLLERERESETRLAADAERMRIAREMHDVIAHSLSVIIAQADGGRYAAKADPNAAVEVLETIAHTGRDALAQTRSLLGFLRSDDDDARSAAPLPGIADIRTLIADVRSAGLPVSITGVDSFEEELLPDGAALAVYRIVQEALTNVLKHAGSGVRAHVSLQVDGGELVTRISDDGAGGPSQANAHSGTSDQDGGIRARGHGIVGMKERAALYGGTLTARAIRSRGVTDGKIPDSAFGTATGFLVEARFPLSRRAGAVGAGLEAGTDGAEPSDRTSDTSIRTSEASDQAPALNDRASETNDRAPALNDRTSETNDRVSEANSADRNSR